VFPFFFQIRKLDPSELRANTFQLEVILLSLSKFCNLAGICFFFAAGSTHSEEETTWPTNTMAWHGAGGENKPEVWFLLNSIGASCAMTKSQ
jgi:hypothetical protein